MRYPPLPSTRQLLARGRTTLMLGYLGAAAALITLIIGTSLALLSHFLSESLQAHLRAAAVVALREGPDREPRAEGRRETLLTFWTNLQGQWVAGDPPMPGLPLRVSVQRALQGRSSFVESSLRGLGPVGILSLPRLDDGRLVGAIQVVEDATAYQDVYRDTLLTLLLVGALGMALSIPLSLWLSDRALEPLARALRLERDFIASVTHEFRTPLTILRAGAELALASPHPEDWQAALRDSLRDIDHLADLLSHLTTLARYDARREAPPAQPVDLCALAKDVGHMLAPLAKERGIALHTDLPPGPPVVTHGDVLALRQLLLILGDNALKFTEAGGRVTLHVGRRARRAVLRVEDTGIGIPPEELPRVTERFFRGQAARTRSGFGLGLSLAEAIAEAHGGNLHISSQPGQGTAVTVLLPLAGALPHPEEREP